METLRLPASDAIFPENAAYFVAIGAALYAAKLELRSFDELLLKLEDSKTMSVLTDTMPPLFESREEYEDFKERHS